MGFLWRFSCSCGNLNPRIQLMETDIVLPIFLLSIRFLASEPKYIWIFFRKFHAHALIFFPDYSSKWRSRNKLCSSIFSSDQSKVLNPRLTNFILRLKYMRFLTRKYLMFLHCSSRDQSLIFMFFLSEALSSRSVPVFQHWQLDSSFLNGLS